MNDADVSSLVGLFTRLLNEVLNHRGLGVRIDLSARGGDRP